jgi:hypothetical protein
MLPCWCRTAATARHVQLVEPQPLGLLGPPPPVTAYYGGIVAAKAVGAVAGLYPAARAARLASTQALRAT